MIKVSYHKRFSPTGTCYTQAISVKQAEVNSLMDKYYKERELGNPRKREYISGNEDNLYAFNKGLEVDRKTGGEIYLSLTQTRFFNLFLDLPLKDRNTCLLVR